GQMCSTDYDQLPDRGMITEIRVVPTKDCSKLILPESVALLFSNFENLKKIYTTRFDTRRVRSMNKMFWNDCSLETLDLSGFDTGKVRDTSEMFKDCSSLKTLDLSGFDTSRNTFMYAMFFGCSSLKTLDLSSFDTSQVTNMNHMFYLCSSLEELDLSGFDTANAGRDRIVMMLEGCSSLQKLNLSKDFFNGNMLECYPYQWSTLWVHPTNACIEKSWREMERDWSDEDAGWWSLSWKTLEFDTGGGADMAGCRVMAGSCVELSQFVPEKPGFTFTGWYLDADCSIKADDSLILKENRKVYAGWEIQYRTLTFETNGGLEMKPLTAAYGRVINLKITKPVKPGSVFKGWYTDPACTKKAKDLFILRSDQTVYAAWEDPDSLA
ncbi:MAG: BspA family leucine-rich repeat surface protein, partial [Erysipelotrichaceae bacterium]|nr:BspA family leucine-rich repeat surface protein [Erysipelotrichaceae bacterium]